MSAAIQVDVASRTVKARGAFSVVFSFVLLTIVVTGFMPTFFLNAFMAKRPIPIQVLLHGLAATSWFVLLCFRSWPYIEAGRERIVGWAQSVSWWRLSS